MDAVHRHVTAARSFHAGLVSETHRHLHELQTLDRHLSVLRFHEGGIRQRLAAAHASCRVLTRLEALGKPWRETYRDLRRSIRRVRMLLRQMVRRNGVQS